MNAVSIIIPTFNGASVPNQQLQALADETVDGGIEVIISDNGSQDNTVEIAESYYGCFNLIILDSSHTRGQTHARNEGVVAANSDFLLFLDQDDVISPGYVAIMLGAIKIHGFVAAHMDSKALNDGWRSKSRSLPQDVGLGTGGLPWAYGCTLGTTKKLFQALDGFDTTLYRSAEDVDFCWRAAKAGYQLVFVPEATLHYRFPESASKLFRQGFHYGVGQALVDGLHPDVAEGAPSPAVRAKLLAHSLGATIAGPTHVVRARGAVRLGRWLGYVAGQLRFARRISASHHTTS